MATKQRKRSAPAPKKAPAPKSKPAPRAKKKSTTPWGWAVAALLLSIFSALGYFRVDGIVIQYLVALEAGLLGWGFWLMPPILLSLCIQMMFSAGRPYKLRCFCIALLPLLFATTIHTLVGSMEYTTEKFGEYLAYLWQTGPYHAGGGVLGGLLACGLSATISKAGTILTMLVLLALCLLIITETKPATVMEGTKKAVRESTRHGGEVIADMISPREADMLDESSHEPQPGLQLPFMRRKSMRDYDLPVGDQPREDVMNVPAVADIMSETEQSAPVDDLIPVEQVPPQRTRREKLLKSANVANPADFLAKKVAQGKEAIFGEPQEEPIQAEPPKPAPRKAKRPVVSDGGYPYPSADLLKKAGGVQAGDAASEVMQTERLLAETVESFGIEASVVGRTRGPSVTRYELRLPPGIKLAKLTNLAGDIAMRLGVVNVRIAPITGKNAVVGVEVPNQLVTPVPIRTVIESEEFRESRSKVSFAVGKDIAGRCVVGDISTLPHLLIAGTTGSGKSVCTNSLIISMLYKSSPEEVRLIMVDPKKVELEVYNGIPHLLIPVVTDPKKAAGALQWAVFEMMRRYQKMADWHVRDMESYNKAVREDIESGEEPLPRLVVIIDELADLMLVAAKEVEESICRLAQMGRACGIHLVIATQRPSANVITGLMKANIPSRIAFAVASQLESRIILDTSGAEKLVGKGDMLFAPLGKTKKRVQGCLISEEEVSAVVRYIKENSEAQYSDDVLHQVEENARRNEKNSGKASAMNVSMPEGDAYGRDFDDERDEHFYEAVDLVVEAGEASTSMLQRRLKLGYARAGRVMDQLEEYGYVGPSEGSKPRKVLISKEKWAEKKLQLTEGALDADYHRAKDMSAAYESDLPFDPD